MKPTAMHGGKHRSFLMFAFALALFLCDGALLSARILLNYPYVTYFFVMALVGKFCLCCFAAYETYFRYRALVNVEEGKDIDVISENTGALSHRVLAR